MRKYKQALKKIDELVSSDSAFGADCYLGLDKPRGKKPNPKYAKDWAKLIIEIYKITHPLLHSCCRYLSTTNKEEK